MKRCVRCLYPENAKPTIIFDENGLCSGCNYYDTRKNLKISWGERKQLLEKIIEESKDYSKKNNSNYDCIIPVSGGKDSSYQVYYLKKNFNIKPLLVSFNHCFNTSAGNQNLKNLIVESGFDHIRFTAGLNSVKKISKYMLEKVGDITWHYHAGIRTVPVKVAIEKKIPLIIWGEHGFGELTGLISFNNFVEYTKWSRLEHDMRGIEAESLVGNGDIDIHDIHPYQYPNDKEVANLDLRGIYLGNYIEWNHKKNTEIVTNEFGFKSVRYKRERTFNLHAKIEDHANDIHDYMKYLKFGYGRATDDASQEIRNGRLTREEGIEIVKKYDHIEPSSLKKYCEFLDISVEHFYSIINKQRSPDVWQINKKDGSYSLKKSLDEQVYYDQAKIDKFRVRQSNDRVFSVENRNFYYNEQNPPEKSGDENFDINNIEFDAC